jgi:hypothetical protein
MTNDPRDQQSGPEFEQDLEAVRSAWSGLEKTEPPDLLNQAVLNTARRELQARRKSRPLRWLGGFATATVIVLALTIVIQQDEQKTPPTLEKTNGFMLDEEAPEAHKKEMKRSVAAPPVPVSDTATLAVAEEMSDSLAEPAREDDRVPEADAWIQRLLLLRETGQDEKLVEELAAFREAFPDYPLPPELRR